MKFPINVLESAFIQLLGWFELVLGMKPVTELEVKNPFSLRRAARCFCVIFTLVGLCLVGPALVSQAVVLQEMSVAYEGVLAGNFVTAGNTVLTCSESSGSNASHCAAARNRSGSLLNNDDFVMTNIKVPFGSLSNSDYFNSSSAAIVLPTGSVIVHATLYWTGTLRLNTGDVPAQNATANGSVLFAVPDQDCSLTGDPCLVSARRTDIYQVNPNTNLGPYRASKDVTDLLTADNLSWSVSGPHQQLNVSVANIQTTTGRDKAAGWGLMIAYENPNESVKHIRILKGFGQESLLEDDQISFDGFETAATGDVLTEFGMITFDGDAGSAQDSISTNDLSGSAIISDSVNPDNNIANSSISMGGVISPYLTGSAIDRHKNTFGVDVDRISLVNSLGHESTSVDLLPSVTGDTFYISGVALATEIVSPNLKLTKFVSAVSGGDPDLIESGDAITYTITAENIGKANAKSVVIRDEIPADVDVTGSTGLDCGTVPSGEICKDLGTINAGTTKSFTISGTLNGAAIGTTNEFSNRVSVTFTGPLGEQQAVSDEVVVAYGNPTADLASQITFTRNFIQAGQSSTVTIKIANLGAASDSNPSVDVVAQAGAKLTIPSLPTGCSKLSTTTMRCSAVAFGISSANKLDPGESKSLRFSVVPASSTSSLQAWATVTTGVAAGDPNPTNDVSDDLLYVNHKPAAKAISIKAKAGGKPVQVSLASKVSDPDGDSLHIRLGKVKHGKATVQGRVLTYTPPKNWSGKFKIRYYVSDGKGGRDRAWITIRVSQAKNTGRVHYCIKSGC